MNHKIVKLSHMFVIKTLIVQTVLSHCYACPLVFGRSGVLIAS